MGFICGQEDLGAQLEAACVKCRLPDSPARVTDRRCLWLGKARVLAGRAESWYLGGLFGGSASCTYGEGDMVKLRTLDSTSGLGEGEGDWGCGQWLSSCLHVGGCLRAEREPCSVLGCVCWGPSGRREEEAGEQEGRVGVDSGRRC